MFFRCEFCNRFGYGFNIIYYSNHPFSTTGFFPHNIQEEYGVLLIPITDVFKTYPFPRIRYIKCVLATIYSLIFFAFLIRQIISRILGVKDIINFS